MRFLPLVLAAAILVLPAPAAALLDGTVYVYVPGLVTVQTEGSAEQWLANAEAAVGVESQSASDDPLYADKPNLKYVDRAARVMQRHWERLDAACDPDAVFALMYLETTYTVRDHIAAGFFDDNEQLAIVTVAFLQLYFDAYHAWHAGDVAGTPLPWQEAFSGAEEHRTSTLEDEFLGINGHVNYDLAIAMWQTGIDESRKPDHDRINRVLLAAAPRVGARENAEYGLAETSSSGDPNDPFTHTVLWPVYDWRELAWHNAMALTNAQTDAERAAIDAEMQTHGFTVAQGLQTPKAPGDWEARLALCEAGNA
ncbi:MAG TPA: DUF5995 family protein [Candidatus Thermoplasmatota archaeon]|nr:DUF5995 family protein [Candidatus Thermoplasmatota archaeon]